MQTISIAIDGPSGAGKSTLARSIAAKLGYLYVDTGAIYRTIGYHAFSARIDPKDEAAVSEALPELRVELAYGEDGLQHMFLNGQDVTKEIRLPEVSMYASSSPVFPSRYPPCPPIPRCGHICWRCSGSWHAPTTSSWTAGISARWSCRTPRSRCS